MEVFLEFCNGANRAGSSLQARRRMKIKSKKLELKFMVKYIISSKTDGTKTSKACLLLCPPFRALTCEVNSDWAYKKDIETDPILDRAILSDKMNPRFIILLFDALFDVFHQSYTFVS